MAFALAIAPEFGLVVLDEPTYGLDQQAIETLAEVLREGLPQGIRQVILISHEPGLRDAATASVYELRNEGGVTVVG
jgi:DNA repair exonuclease SbcCD ATPase subunit